MQTLLLNCKYVCRYTHVSILPLNKNSFPCFILFPGLNIEYVSAHTHTHTHIHTHTYTHTHTHTRYITYSIIIHILFSCMKQEMLKKCSQCMEIIVCAKDRQAAEANKNASILLQQLDDERVMLAVHVVFVYLLYVCVVWYRKMKRVRRLLLLSEEPRRNDKGRKSRRLS